MSGFTARVLIKAADYISMPDNIIVTSEQEKEYCNELIEAMVNDYSDPAFDGYYQQEGSGAHIKFGTISPGAIRTFVKNMKAQTIISAAHLVGMINHSDDEMTLPEWIRYLGTDNQQTFYLKNAAKLIDNTPCWESPVLFYDGCWQCYPDDYQCEEIMNNIEEYAVLDVTFK